MTTLNPNATNKDYLDASAEIISEFAKRATGTTFECPTFGPGTLTTVSGKTFSDVTFAITFADVTKSFKPSVSLPRKFLSFVDPEIKELYETYLTASKELDASWSVIEAEHEAQRQELLRLEAEAKKKAEAEAKAAAKLQAKIDKTRESFREAMVASHEFFETAPETLWFNIGWLAKHAGVLFAKMPEYLEDDFIRQFGDVPRMIIDSKKRTSGGFAYQWTYEFKFSLKKVKEVPISLHNIVPADKKPYIISKTSLLGKLVRDYGFNFNKTQDVDLIKSYVPTQYMINFEHGYAS